MSEPEDLDLFAKIQKGDLKSYQAVFKQYYAELVRYCTGMVRNKVVAEEIIQEVFVYIWEKRNKIEINSSLASYLYTAAKNRSINYLKFELPRQQATLDVSEINLIVSQPDHDPVQTNRLKKKIRQSIDQLPIKCKQIFIMSRYGGLTYNEIAEELEVSVKTVENQMSIALRKLREWLEPELKQFLNE